MIFDGTAGRVQFRTRAEIGEPTIRSFSGGTYQPNRRVANRRKRTCVGKTCTMGREPIRHLMSGHTNPSGLPAGSLGGTDKDDLGKKKDT